MNDLINGSFEVLSGFMVLNHCRAVKRDKAVAGVSIISVFFFTIWGVWNLYYYPTLGQTISFYGSIVIVLANVYWVCLLIKFKRAAA